MVPAHPPRPGVDLRARASSLLYAAAHAGNVLFFRACYRRPRIDDVSGLLDYVQFLQTLLKWQDDAGINYPGDRWSLYGWPRYSREVWLGCEDLIRLASPLYLGRFEPGEGAKWLEDLEVLQARGKGSCHGWQMATASGDHAWDVMYSLPGEARPLKPRRLENQVDVERAYQAAQRWCEGQLRRDRRRCAPAKDGSAGRQGTDGAFLSTGCEPPSRRARATSPPAVQPAPADDNRAGATPEASGQTPGPDAALVRAQEALEQLIYHIDAAAGLLPQEGGCLPPTASEAHEDVEDFEAVAEEYRAAVAPLLPALRTILPPGQLVQGFEASAASAADAVLDVARAVGLRLGWLGTDAVFSRAVLAFDAAALLPPDDEPLGAFPPVHELCRLRALSLQEFATLQARRQSEAAEALSGAAVAARGASREDAGEELLWAEPDHRLDAPSPVPSQDSGSPPCCGAADIRPQEAAGGQSFVERAAVVMVAHFDWTAAQVAEALGMAKATFYRRLDENKNLKAAWKARRGARGERRRGFKDGTCNVDAPVDPHAEEAC